MRIVELLEREGTELGVKVLDRGEVVGRLVFLANAGRELRDTVGYKEGTLIRETLGSMTIGERIAIPHVKVGAVKEPGLAAMVVPEDVDYNAFSGSLASLLFMVATPAEGIDVHLETLSRLSTLFMDSGLKEEPMGATDKDESLRIIDGAETERFEASERGAAKDTKVDAEIGASSSYRALVVTACPTGIARTYMAAENLENTGKKLEIALKAEIDGPGGTQDVPAREEIAAADVIIVAADKNVEMAKFDGRPVVMVPVANGIHKVEELVKRAADGTMLVHHHTGVAGRESVSEGNDSTRGTIYKYLVNGASHVLPFVIGGGILITLAFLFDDYSINPANFGKNMSLIAHLRTTGERVFGIIFLILAGLIAMSIADCPGLAVGLMAELIVKMGSTSVDPAGGDVDVGFLGALFAGFIGRYIVVGLRKLFSELPEPPEGIKPVLLHPVIDIFLATVVTTLISPHMGMINDGLTHFLSGTGGTGRIVLGVALGGMMSIDMGGPFDKAAYVFKIAQLAEGSFGVTVTVMADDTVPPTTAALCTTFSKSKSTEEEHQSGIISYTMGLPFITEGAIPFAVQDPLRVIPSCITGSAITGELSMAFGCTLGAPHGGIFVLPTIGDHLMYLAAVVTGVAVECMTLRVLKKSVAQ